MWCSRPQSVLAANGFSARSTAVATAVRSSGSGAASTSRVSRTNGDQWALICDRGERRCSSLISALAIS
jgi:hypothetical protein